MKNQIVWAGLLVGCATMDLPPLPTDAPLEPNAVERSCMDAISNAGALLASEEFTTCQRDSDCRGISPLLSGRCETVANAKVFEAHLDDFRAQTATCDPVVQLVPRCVRLQPVCRAGRCAGEPISELPDECAELRSALEVDADRENTCAVDAECTVMEDDRPTSVAFLAASIDRQEALARACGTAPPMLFVAHEAPTEAFCVMNRCVTEKANPKFTTVVKDRRRFTPPEIDTDCVTAQFTDAFKNLHRRREWFVEFVANLDANGRLNQYEFIAPVGLSLQAQRALASRLSDCRAQPARYRGKPIAIRKRMRIKWVSK